MYTVMFENGEGGVFDSWGDAQIAAHMRDTTLKSATSAWQVDDSETLAKQVERINALLLRARKPQEALTLEFAGREIRNVFHVDGGPVVIVFVGGQTLKISEAGCGCCASGVDLSY